MRALLIAVAVVGTAASSAGVGFSQAKPSATPSLEGVWKATSVIATVQVSTSPRFPYVTIMIDGGRTSSANTKPQNVDDTMP